MKKIIAAGCFSVISFFSQAQNWQTTLNSGSGLKLGLTTNHPLSFYSNGNLKMQLTDNGLLMMSELKLDDHLGFKYTPGTASVPNLLSFRQIADPLNPPTVKYKTPCNVFNPVVPTNPYPTMPVFQNAATFADLLQIYDAASSSYFLNMGIYNGDGIISVEPVSGAANTNNKLRLNAGCLNDVNICEGGGFTKMFNSAGVLGDLDVSSQVRVGTGTFGSQSALEMNLETGLAKAILVTNPASSATNKQILEVTPTGKTSLGTNLQANTSMFTVGQASKSSLALCLTDNTSTTNKNFVSMYGNGQTFIGADLQQTTGAMFTVGQASKSALALSLTDNTSTTNKDFFNVYGNGYTEIKVYSPAAMPVPAYSGATGPRVFTIRDFSNNKDLFVVRADGKVYAREVEINLATNFPDYVFSKNYDLKPIPEVAGFIDQYQHLPGFEKGEFYEKNGINVNTMIIKQQEKIEEQMLYIIQLEKRLQALENKR